MPGCPAGLTRLKQFKKIYIEITNRCNLTCSFCLPSQRPGAFMQQQAFAEILRKISGYTGHICLHVLGEPLLHPGLAPFLALSRAHGLQVNLTTNGTLLARSRDLLLRQPALRQVNISLHSFEQPRPETALDTYLAPIFDFIAAAVPASPLYINLRMWNLGTAPEPGMQDLESLLLGRLAHHFGLPATLTGTPANVRNIILVDGTVVPCCLDAEGDIPLGNVLLSTLAEILAGPRAAAMREGFARQQVLEPVCRRCTYRQRFQRSTPARPSARHIAGGRAGGA
jgi:sulfatase maturation enzyme AslB (radical SAM superfamily)